MDLIRHQAHAKKRRKRAERGLSSWQKMTIDAFAQLKRENWENDWRTRGRIAYQKLVPLTLAGQSDVVATFCHRAENRFENELQKGMCEIDVCANGCQKYSPISVGLTSQLGRLPRTTILEIGSHSCMCMVCAASKIQRPASERVYYRSVKGSCDLGADVRKSWDTVRGVIYRLPWKLVD